MLRFNPQQYRILDFYEWHQRGELYLQPKFQRRPSWTEKARSYLIDTILKELPVPKLFLRETTDLNNRTTIREVVDGQQRLKAVLDFIEGHLVVSKNHNEVYANLKFNELPPEVQKFFLSYRFTVDLLEGATDADVLSVFSRLNSYTLTLNAQEKLNAEFSGSFKQKVYELGFTHYNFWLRNKILTDRAIARMGEAELTSELVIAMLDGLQQGKTSIRTSYRKHDERFPEANRIEKEFNTIIDSLSETFKDDLRSTRFRRLPLFYSLFCVFYDARFGLPKSTKPQIRFTKEVMQLAHVALLDINERINWSKPQREYSEFVNASGKGTAFLGYRQIRHNFIWHHLFSE
jgi:hypothetical protein